MIYTAENKYHRVWIRVVFRIILYAVSFSLLIYIAFAFRTYEFDKVAKCIGGPPASSPNLKLYASFGAGIIFLILISLRASFFLSFLGGVLYAVSSAAINGMTDLSLLNNSYILGLFKAKILLGNIKPANPELLSFVNRIAWNYPLQSATFASYWRLFHLSFYFFILVLFITFLYPKPKQSFIKQLPVHSFLICLIILFFLLFIYLELFSAYVMLFLCISLILLCVNLQKSLSNKKKYFIPIIITLLVIFEALWSLSLKPTNLLSYKTDEIIITWAKNVNLTDKNVLCDFSISPIIETYGNANSLLDNNLQSIENVDKIKEFYDIMYSGSENDLLNFCVKNNIDYFIFSKDMALGNIKEKILYPYSKRYIGNCFCLIPRTPAYKMYYTPLKLKSFYLLDQKLPVSLSGMISIYRVISESDVKEASHLTRKAQYYFDNGAPDKAKSLISSAIELAPNLVETRFLYYRLYNKWPFVTLNGVKGQKLN